MLEDRRDACPTLPTRRWLPSVRGSGAMIVLMWLTGCSTLPVDDAARAQIQARATRLFDRVMMAKPDEASAAAFPLAPLILFETMAKTSPALPVEVLTWTNRARLRGEEVAQVIFTWTNDAGPAKAGTPSGATSAMQGVRLTLNTEGHPIIWEVLNDRSGARVLYVAQSLEAEAMRQFDASLPGHRFWIETSDAGRGVIAGVLDEAAVPMGPIVYLEAGSGDVSTIICRCMPAQAREVSGTQLYVDREIDEAGWKSLNAATRRQLKRWWRDRAPEDLTPLFRLAR